MFSHCLRLAVAAVATCLWSGHAAALRVCADPNNLPYSNHERQGFENKIMEVIAAELGEQVEYTWWPQRRGFIRSTLAAHRCDVIPGVPKELEMVSTTMPYYRSSYMFVTRREGNLKIASLDDPKLRTLSIGVQIIGDDGSNSPPAHALSRRGIIDNVRGFAVYGDYGKPHPLSDIIDAVAEGKIDVAIAWGPLAGYFAKVSRAPLSVSVVEPVVDGRQLPMTFDISMGVRRGDRLLAERLESALARRRGEIDRILAEYSVPRLDTRLPALRARP